MFERLSARYGNKFATMWAGIDPDVIKREWAMGLAGFSREEIVAGMRASIDREWPPNLAEFRACCRPVPDYEAMYREGANGVFRTPLAFWAALRFGRRDMTGMAYQGDAKARWVRTVDGLRGADLEPIPDRTAPALTAPGEKYTPEVAQAAMKRIMAMLGQAS